MLSRAEYRGRLPYEEYVRRHKLREAANIERIKELGGDIPRLPSMPDKKEVVDAATEKAKKDFHDAVKNQTGIDTDELSKAYDRVKGGLPKTPEDRRKKNEIITGIAIHKAIIPNTESLTQEEIDMAKLSKAGKIAHLNDDEFRAAQDYMDENNLGEIDTELSDSSGLVVKRPNGDIEIHYRGTALTNKPNYQDLITDAAIVSGTESGVPGFRELSGKPKQMTTAEQQLQRALSKYGSIDHLGGYSRGGGMALHFGNKYNIPTTTFNPLIGPNAIANSHSTTADHTIIRTTEDPTTMGLAFSSPNSDSWKVKAILPHGDYNSNIPLKNVYDAHRLDNFTRQGPRKNTEAEITKAHKAQKVAADTQGERMMLGDMRESIKNGESFSDYMLKYNPGDTQSTPEGPRLKGLRFGEKSSYTEGWYKVGGRFTDGEAKYINQIREGIEEPTPHTEPPKQPKKKIMPGFEAPEQGILIQQPTEDQLGRGREELEEGFTSRIEAEFSDPKLRAPGQEESKLMASIKSKPSSYNLSNDEIEEFRENGATDEELANKLTQAEQNHFKAIQDLDDISSAAVEHAPVDSVGRSWRSANATNLAIGYGIGLGVQGLANLVPGEKDFEATAGGRATMDVSKGAATGVAQALTTKGLGGLTRGTVAAGIVGNPEDVAILPELVGGAAGYVAGDYASEGAGKLAKMAGAKKGTQKLAADVVGGGVGGSVGALATIGTAVAADALLGTEYGAVLGPEGAAIGGLIGTGLGLGAAIKEQGFKGVASDVKEIAGGVESLEDKAGQALTSGIKSIGKSIASWF